MKNLISVETLSYVVGLLLAIIPHEIGHALVAYLMGDSTAKESGRFSLNPFRHLDPLGIISLLLFRFGWAKPVPIDPRRFKKKKLGMVLVSLAGIFVNFIILLISGAMYVYANINDFSIISMFSLDIMRFNATLAIFNLIPLPPLDGSKLLATFLPDKIEFLFYKYERILYVFLIFVIFSGYINNIMLPLVSNMLSLSLKFGVMINGL